MHLTPRNGLYAYRRDTVLPLCPLYDVVYANRRRISAPQQQ